MISEDVKPRLLRMDQRCSDVLHSTAGVSVVTDEQAAREEGKINFGNSTDKLTSSLTWNIFTADNSA